MRSILTLAVAWMSLLGIASPASAFFEAFSTLSDELKAIEQSSPEGLGNLLEKLDATSTTKFGDVRSTDWFYRYVFSVARWGIASGYKNAAGQPTGIFGPGNTVTVAEILKMALKSAQVDETQCRGTPWFAQGEKHWARAYVLCAQERNMRLIQSAPDLNRPARRAEVLSVIFDAFGDEPPPLFSPFKDTVNHPLESDIAYAAALKMVSGDKDAAGNPLGTFRPNDPIVRAEAAKIIYERLRVEVMGKE